MVSMLAKARLFCGTKVRVLVPRSPTEGFLKGDQSHTIAESIIVRPHEQNPLEAWSESITLATDRMGS